MTGTQWLLLVLVIGAVVGAYFYIRRQDHDDPWHDMDENDVASDDDIDRGMSLGGDSYIVGVRTISPPQDDDAPPSRPSRAPVEEPVYEETRAPISTPRERPTPPPRPAQNNPSAPLFDPEPDPNFGQSSAYKPEQSLPPETSRLSDAKKKLKGKLAPPWAAFSPKSTTPKSNPETDRLKPQRAPAGEEKLFIVHVASRDQRFFDGPDVHAALRAEKLQFGMHNIYHRITEVNGVPDSVYAVANMLKPGFLDPMEQDHLSTPGLTIFLQLPGPIEAAKATREMLETAGALAQHLGAEVLDDKRVLLKAQSAQFMLDEAAELDRKQRLHEQR